MADRQRKWRRIWLSFIEREPMEVDNFINDEENIPNKRVCLAQEEVTCGEGPDYIQRGLKRKDENDIRKKILKIVGNPFILQDQGWSNRRNGRVTYIHTAEDLCYGKPLMNPNFVRKCSMPRAV
ncbi:hypothetical protein L6452_31514 [Arctium lappa]|uniref:Uncharacterized protein n=1 Tax=Arctium lappa TaxID=4217 RepID=A0ACB8Z1N6_ARCLA|nr:hypothetical protein L6452_31514 [Arctium lappa]